MKILDEIELKPKEDCRLCLGRGYVLILRPELLDSSKYRVAIACPRCMRQVVKIEEE